MKKYLLIVAKLIITTLVFWWVIHKLGDEGLNKLWVNIQSAQPLGLCFAMMAFLFGMSLGICRWWFLLRAQGIHFSFYQTTWICAVGLFFNAFLIGATGGDVLKAWYAAEAARDRKPHAVLSVLVDRVIGFVGLFLLATLLVISNLQTLLNHDKTRPLAYLVIGSLATAMIAIALTTQRHRIASQSWWKYVWQYIPGKRILVILSESYDLYGKHPRTLLLALILSIGVHASMVVAIWFIGGAIRIENVGLENYFVYCPLINAFAAIPITISGLGLREEAFKFFFSMRGVPDDQAVALSLLFYATSLIVSLACGILYMMGNQE